MRHVMRGIISLVRRLIISTIRIIARSRAKVTTVHLLAIPASVVASAKPVIEVHAHHAVHVHHVHHVHHVLAHASHALHIECCEHVHRVHTHAHARHACKPVSCGACRTTLRKLTHHVVPVAVHAPHLLHHHLHHVLGIHLREHGHAVLIALETIALTTTHLVLSILHAPLLIRRHIFFLVDFAPRIECGFVLVAGVDLDLGSVGISVVIVFVLGVC